MKSNWKRGWHLGCELQPGQFATGREAAAEELGVSGSAWYRGMQKLQEFGCIKLEVNNRFTKVLIVNWDKYQGEVNNERTTDEQQADNERTTGEQPADTIEEEQETKEEREGEEGKKSKAAKPAELAPELLEWIAFWTSLKNRGLVLSGVSLKPGKGLIKAWTRVQKSDELQELLTDKAAIEAAITESPFLQKAGWFCLEKLLGGSNGDGCYIARRLLDGGYRTSEKNAVNLGAGVNFANSAHSGSGIF